MKRHWALIGGAALLALAAIAAGFLLSRPDSPPSRSPLPLPGVVEQLFRMPLADSAGRKTTLARWRGKPLLVNFWATWCPPCLVEMPMFSRLQEKHGDIQFVGIAIDTTENVQRFSTSTPVSYPLLVGAEGAMSLLGQLGNDRSGLPFTLVLDGTGRVRHARLGGLTEAETEDLIAGLR